MRKKRELQPGLPKRSDPEYMKKYNARHKERISSYRKTKYANSMAENPNFNKDKYDPVVAKKYATKRRKQICEHRWKMQGIVGITFEIYTQDLISCGGLCKICQNPMRIPHVDHCHETGRYRGLLCSRCNLALGVYEKHFEAFSKYLSS